MNSKRAQFLAPLACALGLASFACNALLGTPEERLAGDGGSDGASLDTRSDAALMDTRSEAESLDAGFEAESLDAGFDTALAVDCGDTGSNPLNCGSCGHSCLLGECDAGSCQPFALVRGEQLPNDIIADPGASGSVFWTEYSTGSVKRFDKATSRVVFEYTPVHPAAPNVAANDQYVFWTAPYPGQIAWATRDGSQTGFVDGSQFGASWLGAWPIAIDDEYIYWCNRFQSAAECWRLDLTFKTAAKIYTSVTPDGGVTDDPFALAVTGGRGDAGYVYVTASGELLQMNKDGTDPRPFGPVATQYFVGLDDGYVYWQGVTGEIFRRSESSVLPCPPTCNDNLIAPAQPAISSMAFDQSYVYWRDTVSIRRAKKDGSSVAAEIVHEEADAGPFTVAGLAVDDVAIYYITQTNGSVWRLAK